MKNMKAAVFSYPPHVEVVDVPDPSPERGEVVIQVEATALCGTDLRITRRGHGTIAEGEKRVLGHEVVGRVAALGEGVEGFSEGEAVAIAPNFGCGKCLYCIQGNTHHCPETKAMGITYDGGFARFMRVPERAVRQGNIFPLWDGAEYTALSFVEAFACVVHGFLPLQVKTEDRVLIYGAGPIGMMFAELAQLRGAREVWVADLSRDRLETASSRGAGIIPVKETPVNEVISGADVVVVAAPAPRAQQEALEIASVYGRVNFFGGLPPQVKEVPLHSNVIHYKELMVTGTTKSNNYHFRLALDFLRHGQIDLSYLASHVLPLEKIEEGLALMESQKSLKVVLKPNTD